MTRNELDSILLQHSIWLKSGGMYGVRANLLDADLSNTDLSSVDLSRANLTRANLTGANLRSDDLSDVDLSYANLSDSDLTSANLSDAYLTGANLSDAQFEHEIMSANSLFGCTMSWSQSCWVVNHTNFNTIKFV